MKLNLVFLILTVCWLGTAHGSLNAILPVLTERYCSCHLDFNPSMELIKTADYKPCMTKVVDEYKKAFDSGEDFEKTIKKFIRSEENTGAPDQFHIVCNNKDVKNWFETKYKLRQSEENKKQKILVQEQYCGLKKGDTAGVAHENCFKRLAGVIAEEDVKNLKEECREDKLNQNKQTRKVCVEIEKAKYILAVEKNEDHSLDLYPSVCKKGSEGELQCLDSVGKELSKVDCSDYDELTTKEGQEICRKIIFSPRLKTIADADGFKSCVEKTNVPKEKANCIKDSKSNSKKSQVADATECDKIADASAARKCLAELNRSKTKTGEVKSKGGIVGFFNGLFGDDEAITGEEDWGDLSKSQRKHIAKAIKNYCSCERLDQDAAIKECVVYATNNDKLDSELGKKLCSKEETAEAKKKKNSEIEKLEEEVIAKFCSAETSSSKKKSCLKNNVKIEGEKAKLTDKYKACSNAQFANAEVGKEDCEYKAILTAMLEGGESSGCNEVYNIAKSDGTDQKFLDQLKSACRKAAPKEDAQEIYACIKKGKKDGEASTTEVEGEKGKKRSDKEVYDICIVNKIAPSDANNTKANPKLTLGEKYPIRFGSSQLKDMFIVSGCEDVYEDKEAYEKCAKKRVGQELLKATLTELSKRNDPVGALAATGLGVTECMSSYPRPEKITKPADFCSVLKNTWGDTQNMTVDRNTICITEMDRICSKYQENGKFTDAFYACGEQVVACIKVRSRTTSEGLTGDNINDSMTCQYEGMDFNAMVGTSKPNYDNNSFKRSTCMAAAALNGINAVTIAVCNKKKTEEEKAACFKKARALTETAKAGASVAECMQEGPAFKIGMSNKDENGNSGLNFSVTTEPNEKNDILREQRKNCLIRKLGTQGLDLLTENLKNEKAKNAVKTLGNLALATNDCAAGLRYKKLSNPEMSQDESDANKKDFNMCLARGAIGAAIPLVAQKCEKMTDEAQKRKCNLAVFGLATSSKMLTCANKTGDAAAMCVATQGLAALGEMPGRDCTQITDKGEQQKCEAGNKLKIAAKIGSEVLAFSNAMKSCTKNGSAANREECMIGALATILPGDAQIYVKSVVGLSGFLKQKNQCQVPSKYLTKASGATNIVGDLVTHMVHKNGLNILEDKYADLMGEHKANPNSLSGAIDSFVNRQKIEANKKHREALAKIHEGSDNQKRALEFQLENEQLIYKRMKTNHAFLVTSSVLNISASIAATAEAIIENTPYLQSMAYWKSCESSGTEQNSSGSDCIAKKSASSFKNRDELERSIKEHNFDYLFTSQDVATLYANAFDVNSFSQGANRSIDVNSFYELEKNLQMLTLEPHVADVFRLAFQSPKSFIDNAHADQAGNKEKYAMGMNIVGMAANGIWGARAGFSYNNPLNYAQDIVMTFIMKGFEKACPPGKPPAEQSHFCLSIPAVQFAAKMATKKLMCTYQQEINTFMKSAAGRIIVTGWTDYKIIDNIVQNKKQVVEQKKRVDEVQKMVDGFTIVQQKKKMLDFDPLKFNLISEAHAAAGNAADKMLFCLNRNAFLDPMCECKKTGCYEVIPQGKGMNGFKSFTKIDKSMQEPLSATFNFGNQVNQIMAGAKSVDDLDLNKLEQMQQSLSATQKRMLGALNQQLAKKKGKPLEPQVYFKQMDGRVFASLNPEVRKNLNGISPMGIAPSFQRANSSDYTPTSDMAIAKDDIAPVSNIPLEDQVVKAEIEQVDLVAKTEEHYNQAMKVEYEYNSQSDIVEDKEKGLFDIIRHRYSKVYAKEMLEE